MAQQPIITFHDGHSIPQVGLGVWQTPQEIAAPTVRSAIAAGYRHIDTASGYDNEEGVGEGIRSSGLDRKDIFVTTKLRNTDQGYDATMRAFEGSLRKLGMEYVDLYLIHWPSPHRGLYRETWKAFVKIRKKAVLVRSAFRTSIRIISNRSSAIPASFPSSTRSSCTPISSRRLRRKRTRS